MGCGRVLLILGLTALVGCTKPATTEESGTLNNTSLTMKAASNGVDISAPQVGFTYNDVSFSLVIPTTVSVRSVIWDFGDGNNAAGESVTHVYLEPAVYEVRATITDADGNLVVASHRINTIDLIDGLECTPELDITAGAEATVNIPTTMSLAIPSCLTGKIGQVQWNFGDSQTGSGESVTHTYTTVGSYPVTATLYLGTSPDPWITLTHTIEVVPDTSLPPDPNACSVQGEKRESVGTSYSGTLACGTDGTKTVTYQDRIVEECQNINDVLKWTEISRTKETVSEGACEGQSCKLPDGSVLANGSSKVLYTTSTPAGTCASVSETRACRNGVLSGSSSAVHNTCNNGCGSFGSHGTVLTGIVIGETQVQHQCKYGEQGIFDIYNQIADQTCVDGSMITSNTRQGTIKTAGICPVYSYTPTQEFTACTADCGGKQSRIYACTDDKGVVVDSVRCADQVMPVEQRVCDANPDAVRRQEVTKTTEEANSSTMCPANQIGVILRTREVVQTKTYACIDHKVQLESDVTVPGAWVEESFCRDYVARRCSQDSLDTSAAKGRYEWMVKCQNQLPIIKEFLTNFANKTITIGGKKVSLTGTRRYLYPTFMNHAYSPEKPWIAPTKKSAPCVMPDTVYVATLCVSSCATPEQQILAQESANDQLKYVPFIEALTKNMAFVGTLQSAQSMGSKAVIKSKVDQWVTELMDSEHDILVFKMKSGRELKVTPNHPIVNAEGMMQVAEDFKVGESLVEVGGILDPILSITPTKHFGKVYNIFVQSNAVHKNIVVINGYLNGSAYFQNEGATELNRALFRQKLTRGAVK